MNLIHCEDENNRGENNQNVHTHYLETIEIP